MLFEPSHASDRLFSSCKDIYAMTTDDTGKPTQQPFHTFKCTSYVVVRQLFFSLAFVVRGLIWTQSAFKKKALRF